MRPRMLLAILSAVVLSAGCGRGRPAAETQPPGKTDIAPWPERGIGQVREVLATGEPLLEKEKILSAMETHVARRGVVVDSGDVSGALSRLNRAVEDHGWENAREFSLYEQIVEDAERALAELQEAEMMLDDPEHWPDALAWLPGYYVEARALITKHRLTEADLRLVHVHQRTIRAALRRGARITVPDDCWPVRAVARYRRRFAEGGTDLDDESFAVRLKIGRDCLLTLEAGKKLTDTEVQRIIEKHGWTFNKMTRAKVAKVMQGYSVLRSLQGIEQQLEKDGPGAVNKWLDEHVRGLIESNKLIEADLMFLYLRLELYMKMTASTGPGRDLPLIWRGRVVTGGEPTQ